MATVIDWVPVENQVASLAEHVYTVRTKSKGEETSEDKEAFEKQKQLISTDVQLVLKQLISSVDDVLAISKRDTQIVLNSLNCIIYRTDSLPILEEYLSKITTFDDNTKSITCIQSLGYLFNLYNSNSIQRYHIFIALLQFCIKSNNQRVLKKQVEKLFNFIEDWGLDATQKQTLYKQAVAFHDSSKDYNQKLETLLAYLSQVDQAAEAVDEAVEAVVLAIKLPNVYHYGSLTSSAVSLLKGSPNHSKLVELFGIFSEGSLADFNSFIAENSGLIDQYGFNKEELTEKMKLLSLLSVVENELVISYADIASALSLDVDDVESWVVKAVDAGLIEARLNQVKSSVEILQVKHRSFDSKEWASLAEGLSHWKNNVGHLLEVMDAQDKQKQVPVGFKRAISAQ